MKIDKSLGKIVIILLVIVFVSFFLVFSNFSLSKSFKQIIDKDYNIDVSSDKLGINFEQKKDIKIKKQSSISIEAITADISVFFENRNNILVKYYGNKVIGKEVPELLIDENSKNIRIYIYYNKFNQCAASNSKLEIYVPNDYKSIFELKSISGDVYFKPKAKKPFDKVYLHSTSGDAICQNLILNQLEIGTTSGDITINSVESSINNINTTSGKINVKNFYGGLGIKSVSGDVLLEVVILEDIKVYSVSGDIYISILDKDVGFESIFRTVSGDFDSSYPVKIIKSSKVYIKAKYKNGDKKVDIKTVSGDLSID